MKVLTLLAALLLSSQAFSEDVVCRSQKSIQNDEPTGMKTDAEILFNLNKETKELTNIVGHIFVQSTYIEDEEINTENSYLAFFQFDGLQSNPDYRPNRYKGYTQYKKFDAIHTAGRESGMWGAFVMDLTKTAKTFDARYIFQAGDHMGGTVIFTCQTR